MVCDCCGRKKGLLEFFYSVGEKDENLNVCSDCRSVIEHLESDLAGREMELYEIHLFQLKKRQKNPSPEFLAWQSVHFPPRG